MTLNAIDFISIFFEKVLDLFRSTIFPGTGFSVFTLIIILVAARLFIGFIRMIFGYSFSVAKSDFMFRRHVRMGRDLRGGNNNKIKISDERKNDTL